MKILREFYFADWRFFVVCGNKFLQFEMTEISYRTKGLKNSKTKQKPIPTIHNKSIKSRVFNLTEGS